MPVITDLTPDVHLHPRSLEIAQRSAAYFTSSNVLITDHLIALELVQGIVASLGVLWLSLGGQVISHKATICRILALNRGIVDVIARMRVIQSFPFIAVPVSCLILAKLIRGWIEELLHSIQLVSAHTATFNEGMIFILRLYPQVTTVATSADLDFPSFFRLFS